MAPISMDASSQNHMQGGDSISIQLLSGVTPLLSLLGQEFTNRYLSQSVSRADRWSFALVPTGIPFALGAIIRVSRFAFCTDSNSPTNDYNTEARDITEKDLLSSTSDNVWEVWDGYSVVRKIHHAKKVSEEPIREFILYDNEIYPTTCGKDKSKDIPTKSESTLPFIKAPRKKYYADAQYPPNLSLNLGPNDRKCKSGIVLFCGLLLQLGVLLFAALTTFFPSWTETFNNSNLALRLVAFNFTASGTLFLFLGLWRCAVKIGKPARGQFITCKKEHRGKAKLIWVQNENRRLGIERYIIVQDIEKEFISFHRTGETVKGFELQSPIWSYVSTGAIIMGFLLQSVGLSLMHWPTQLLQLFAVSSMFGLRFWLHRQSIPKTLKYKPPAGAKDWQAVGLEKLKPDQFEKLLWFNHGEQSTDNGATPASDKESSTRRPPSEDANTLCATETSHDTNTSRHG